MHSLKAFLRFVQLKDHDEGSRILRYSWEHARLLAPKFGVTVEAFCLALLASDDEREPVSRWTYESDRRRSRRLHGAQASADALGTFAFWKHGCAHFDLVSAIASVITRPQDLLVFIGERGFEVCVPMRILIGLERLRRNDLTAYVDREGLHLRWCGGSLLIESKPDRGATRIYFPLPSRKPVAAA